MSVCGCVGGSCGVSMTCVCVMHRRLAGLCMYRMMPVVVSCIDPTVCCG